MKWRGVEVADLDDATLVDAFEQGLAIVQELMVHVQRRNLFDKKKARGKASR